ncbi:MAG: hypothetical protein U0939_13345 [Pirellulales bacterium]
MMQRYMKLAPKPVAARLRYSVSRVRAQGNRAAPRTMTALPTNSVRVPPNRSAARPTNSCMPA